MHTTAFRVLCNAFPRFCHSMICACEWPGSSCSSKPSSQKSTRRLKATSQRSRPRFFPLHTRPPNTCANSFPALRRRGRGRAQRVGGLLAALPPLPRAARRLQHAPLGRLSRSHPFRVPRLLARPYAAPLTRHSPPPTNQLALVDPPTVLRPISPAERHRSSARAAADRDTHNHALPPTRPPARPRAPYPHRVVCIVHTLLCAPDTRTHARTHTHTPHTQNHTHANTHTHTHTHTQRPTGTRTGCSCTPTCASPSWTTCRRPPPRPFLRAPPAPTRARARPATQGALLELGSC